MHSRLSLRDSHPLDDRRYVQGAKVQKMGISGMLTGSQTGNPVMMGHTEDPKDGGAVAAAVFGAVAVYGVRTGS